MGIGCACVRSQNEDPNFRCKFKKQQQQTRSVATFVPTDLETAATIATFVPTDLEIQYRYQMDNGSELFAI